MTPTTGDDLIDGTSGDDTIDALAGNDTVNGLQGNDSLDGNAGSDSLSGGDGTDTLNGGDGDDTLLPGSGFDQVSGDAGNDRIVIPAGLDFFNTLQYGDIDGGADADTLALPYSRNFVGLIFADAPSPLGSPIGVIDLFPPFGTPGFDFSISNIEFIEFSDQTLQILLGDTGANGLSVNTGLAGFIYGGDGADTLTGGALFDSIIGGEGDDSIAGGGGGDILQGGQGADTIAGGAGLEVAGYFTSAAGVNVDLAAGTADDGFGSTDTLIDIDGVLGSNFDDTIDGNAQNNSVMGRDGIDFIFGHGGADTLSGQNGFDFLSGGDGADSLNGGNDGDQLSGGDGLDTLNGAGGLDSATYDDKAAGVSVNLFNGTAITGGSLNASGVYVGGAIEDTLISIEAAWGSNFADRIVGSSAQSVLLGFLGNDRITGLNAGDVLNGDGGSDTLEGGGGDDQLFGGTENDTIDGGAGRDTVSYQSTSGGVNVNLTNGVALTGGFVNSAGFYQGGAVEDTIVNVESIQGSEFADRLIGRSASGSVDGFGGDDVIVMFSGNDTLTGWDGNDLLVSGGGTDILFGSAGNDTLNGGTGFDTFDGGTEIDTITYADRTGGVSVNLFNGTGRTAGALNSGGFYAGGFNEDVIRAVENAVGSNFGDRLVASNHSGRLEGLGGADNISGLNGDDTLIGGAGDDTLSGGAGNDTFEFASGFGADRITDFAEGAGAGDVIRLVGLGVAFDSFAEVIASASQSGGDVVFNFGGGNTITVLAATVAGFAADDFSFG